MWKILIITNNKLFEDYYTNDLLFNQNNWSVFNVSQKERMSNSKFDIINALDIDGYYFKGPKWAESEVIYNIYKLDLFKDYDKIGFIHYDFLLKRLDNHSCNITQQINNCIDDNEWISFQEIILSRLLQNSVMVLDDRYPKFPYICNENRQYNPQQAIPIMLDVISNNINCKMKLDEMDVNRKMTSCSAFLTNRENVLEIGKLMEIMLSKYNVEYINDISNSRYIGNLFERMIMLYSYQFQHKEIPLVHKYAETSKGH